MSNASMAVAACISPLLFTTFHSLYKISFSKLGFLVLINFCTQLAVDLLFSFYSYKFKIDKVVRTMPVLTVLGLTVYAVFPTVFPERAYLFLAIGTFIFSAAAGLGEVLISPLIAALPSDNPDRDMSRTHAVYAWSVAAVVLLSTLFLHLTGKKMWFILVLLWLAVPLTAAVLFMLAELPTLSNGRAENGKNRSVEKRALILCILCIFLGGASENTMTQWCSGYLESALGVPKLWGDIFGTAIFAVMLAVGRTLYAKFGKNISTWLLCSFAGSALCYIVAALSPGSITALLACVLTGFSVAMLWPGTLIYTAELIPAPGVAVYALLAAGGDLGGSVAPQLMGVLTDVFTASAETSGGAFGLTAEQFGFKAGMLCAAVFPILGTAVAALLKKSSSRTAG